LHGRLQYDHASPPHDLDYLYVPSRKNDNPFIIKNDGVGRRDTFKLCPLGQGLSFYKSHKFGDAKCT
ncbi:MAG: hypothetical protein QM640_07810, partial [Niabella sp.]